MKTKAIYFSLIMASALVSSATAQSAYVYPARGQSTEQTEKDKRECADWARQQSGFDPSQPVTVATPPPQEGQVARGAGRGAAIGAVGGAIGGEAGKGAAIGAASGALLGGMRRRDEARSADAQQQAVVSQMRSSYDRAYRACLEGKGYTVQ